MSILIKGMVMPKNGEMNKIIIGRAPNGIEPIAIVTWDKTEFYKIFEVLTPHGKLIDADKLVWFIDNHIASGKKWVEFETIKDMINSLPTIIEAEASE